MAFNGIYDDNEFGYIETVRFKDIRGTEIGRLYDGSRTSNPVLEPDTLFATLGNQSVPVRVDAEGFPYAVSDEDGRLTQTSRFRAAPDGGILYDDQGRAVRGLTAEDLRKAEFSSAIDANYQRMMNGDREDRRLMIIIGTIIAAVVLIGLVIIALSVGRSGEQPAPTQPSVTQTQAETTVTVTEQPETTTVTVTPEKTTVTKTETETVTSEPEAPTRTTVTETETVTPTAESPGVRIPGLP